MPNANNILGDGMGKVKEGEVFAKIISVALPPSVYDMLLKLKESKQIISISDFVRFAVLKEIEEYVRALEMLNVPITGREAQESEEGKLIEELEEGEDGRE